MRKRHLPFSASEDLLAGGANVGKLAKLQIICPNRWPSFTEHSGPECISHPETLIKCRRPSATTHPRPTFPVTASTAPH